MPVGTSTGIKSAPADAAGKTLTDAQLATWAGSAGFEGEDRVTAVAIALAESGGRYAVVSAPNFDGTRDYGAWQINSGAWPQLFAQFPEWWDASNAKMAKVVKDKQGWTAWTVYKTGAYLLFLPRARAAVQSSPDAGRVGQGDVGYSEPDTTFSLAKPFEDMNNVLRAGFQPLVAASEWIGNADNWVRVAQVVVGVALVVGGLTIIARPAVQAVAGPVASVVTKGKAGK